MNNRARGVTASAVIAVAGSLVSILFAALMVFGAAMTRYAPPQPAGEQPISTAAAALVLIAMALGYFAFGVWGIVSAVGLWRLRNWARICFAIFGGILASLSVCGVFAFIVSAAFVPPVPPEANVPPGLERVLFTVFAVIALLCAGLGVWWAIYFNRRAVKAQFMGEAAASEPPRFPLGIPSVAWFLIIGGVMVIVPLFLPSIPMLMFGIVLRGWESRLVFLLFAATGLASGIGILKKRTQAYSIAIGYFGFGLLNLGSYFLIPGTMDKMAKLQAEMPFAARSPNTTPDFMWSSMLFGLVFAAIPLWLLLWQRKAFIESCSREAGTGTQGFEAKST